MKKEDCFSCECCNTCQSCYTRQNTSEIEEAEVKLKDYKDREEAAREKHKQMMLYSNHPFFFLLMYIITFKWIKITTK